jgi:hypothetical protein
MGWHSGLIILTALKAEALSWLANFSDHLEAAAVRMGASQNDLILAQFPVNFERHTNLRLDLCLALATPFLGLQIQEYRL